MDILYIKKLIKLVSESMVDEIEIEEEGKKIKIVKNRQNSSLPVTSVHQPAANIPTPSAPLATVHPEPTPAVSPPPFPEPQLKVGEAHKLHEIKSPIVGTFYRSPAPDAAPFVDVGSTIEPGTVLCIVEAMKLMNEIESDVAGKVAKILVENGQAVEFDQALFLVEAA